jgi:hypothetical protein
LQLDCITATSAKSGNVDFNMFDAVVTSGRKPLGRLGKSKRLQTGKLLAIPANEMWMHRIFSGSQFKKSAPMRGCNFPNYTMLLE